MRRRAGRSALCVLASMLTLAACGDRLGKGVVARIAGEPLTAEQFDAYIDRNLIRDVDLEEPDPEQRAQVLSRLFDNFIEERLLLAASRDERIEVSDDEIDLYLVAMAPADEESTDLEDADNRRRAADVLAVQKLREVLVAREVDPASDEIRNEVARRLEEEAGEARVVLRSLMLESEDQAKQVYREIRRRRLTFGEAVVQHGTQPGQGLPVEMELATLPQEVRDGIADLRPGRTAPPVVLHGDAYLFHLERRSGSADRRRRAELRAEILAERRRGVLERVLAELREKKRLRLQHRALPFRYVYNQES